MTFLEKKSINKEATMWAFMFSELFLLSSLVYNIQNFFQMYAGNKINLLIKRSYMKVQVSMGGSK